MKRCYLCLNVLDENFFSKSCKGCKKCESKRILEHKRTKRGLIKNIHERQIRKSIERSHAAPDYTFKELNVWASEQLVFHALYDEWVKSDYDKWLRPSFDRIDDYKPYSFDNIRIVTWRENWQKLNTDKTSGINNKQSTAVIQMDKLGNPIAVHPSIILAAKSVGSMAPKISDACRGKAKTVKGFIWKYQKSRES